MSDALALAGVTAVLQYWLTEVFNAPSSQVGSVLVTARAPDIVQATLAGNDQLQINLFMHQVTPNAAWRNLDLPSLGPDGSTRLASPALALDLHYLLTAYASKDTEAEALLGYAILMLHENPVFARQDVSQALNNVPSSSNPLSNALKETGLADQIEQLKLTPAPLGREEMAWIWTALKADYRPTYPFQVSVALLQPERASVDALPVLVRDISAVTGLTPPFPALASVDPPGNRPAACLGDVVTVTGNDLAALTSVVLANARHGIEQELTPLADVLAGSFEFTIPDPALPPPQPDPTDLPAGVYVLWARQLSGSDVLNTNGLPLALAPRIDPAWAPATLPAGVDVPVIVPCAPYLRPGQEVSLLIGGQQALADHFTTPTREPSFTFATLTATGGHKVPVRLRVDGIDSPIIDLSDPSHPAFAVQPAVEVA